jgi:uncharacterized coiled-coil DUF342 family protein
MTTLAPRCPRCHDTRSVEKQHATHTRLVPCPDCSRGDSIESLRAECERLRVYWQTACLANDELNRLVEQKVAECERMQKLNESLAEQAASAAEVLGKLANRERLTCPKCATEWTP